MTEYGWRVGSGGFEINPNIPRQRHPHRLIAIAILIVGIWILGGLVLVARSVSDHEIKYVEQTTTTTTG